MMPISSNMQSDGDFAPDNCATGVVRPAAASFAVNETGGGDRLPESDGNLTPNSTFVAEEVINSIDEDTPRSFNLYRNKKLISHGMMNVALFSANANQLRYVFETSDGSAVYVVCVVLLLVSIFLQILVGVMLLLSARYNVTDCSQRKMAYRLGNYVIVGIFLVTVVNIFITSFGGPAVMPPTTILQPNPGAVTEPTAGLIPGQVFANNYQ